jgi:hypothetical protein
MGEYFSEAEREELDRLRALFAEVPRLLSEAEIKMDRARED